MARKKLYSVHVQRRDYGYMFGKVEAKSREDAKNIALENYKGGMVLSTNPITRERWLGSYFKGYPYEIKVMPYEAYKGTIMLEDLGKLPKGKLYIVYEGKRKAKKEFG